MTFLTPLQATTVLATDVPRRWYLPRRRSASCWTLPDRTWPTTAVEFRTLASVTIVRTYIDDCTVCKHAQWHRSNHQNCSPFLAIL